MNRAEHLAWCKARAIELVDAGELAGAVASMTSDMEKHPETSLAGPTAMFLMMAGGMAATNGDTAGVRRWVEGFN